MNHLIHCVHVKMIIKIADTFATMPLNKNPAQKSLVLGAVIKNAGINMLNIRFQGWKL